MTHIVIYDRESDAPAYLRVHGLDAAVAEVERLRNHEGITDSCIYELHPVSFQFQPYFRVELAGEREPGEYEDIEDDESTRSYRSIDLRIGDTSGFTTYPQGRRIFAR